MADCTSTTGTQRTHAVSYVGVHDRTPEMRVLYVSPGVQQGLKYEMSEIIGQTAYKFIANVDADEYRKAFGTCTTDNVIIAYVYLQPKTGDKYYVRMINFNCDDINFNIVFECRAPHSALPPRGLSDKSLKRFQCLLDRQQQQHKQQTSHFEPVAELAGTDTPVYTSRASARQACLILEDPGPRAWAGDSSGPLFGPKVVFATNGLGRIIDADACDVQGLHFLALVATCDIVKAAQFLQKTSQTADVVLETLELWEDPVADDASRSIGIEFMAIGADNCIVLLCQLAKRSARGRRAHDDDYLSLEEIISSDPETSDFSEAWRLP